MKSAAYVAWILLCKYCKFSDKIYYNNYINNEFFLRDVFIQTQNW